MQNTTTTTQRYFFISTLFVLAFVWQGCPVTSNLADCELPPTITKIAPQANPPGHEVQIIGTNFDSNYTVNFGTQPAEVVSVTPTLIIAKVPTGVSGSLALSLVLDECTAQKNFDVWSSYPDNLPPSPNVIVIPETPSTFPGSFDNQWVNVFNSEHKLGLFNFGGTGDPDEVVSTAEGGASEELYGDFDKEHFLNHNPISGYFKFDAAKKTSDIKITIDRTAKPNGSKETYTGQLIDPKLVGLTNDAKVILLTSTIDGRQLVCSVF